MSNTAKFPGRRNERRIRALRRIEQQLAADVRRNSGYEYPLTAGDRARLTREGDALALRIRPEAVVRAIRIKKDRSGTGRFSRA